MADFCREYHVLIAAFRLTRNNCADDIALRQRVFLCVNNGVSIIIFTRDGLHLPCAAHLRC